MSFDPSTNAAMLAALAARCEYAQFSLLTVNTIALGAGHEFQRMFEVHPFQGRVAITWTAVYRGTKLAGKALVVINAMTAAGQAAVLMSAKNTLDLIDLKAETFGANPNPYNPRTQGGL